MKDLILLSVLILGTQVLFAQSILKCDSARIEFVSEAPLELISAVSQECIGILDLEKSEFAFRVKIRSFQGFNSPLQREHFNENYMESEAHPTAVFNGRFIDVLDLDSPGEVILKVKGELSMHGVGDERVLEIAVLIDTDRTFSFKSRFEVELETHAIDVPRIVYQKIAQVIDVTVNGHFR